MLAYAKRLPSPAPDEQRAMDALREFEAGAAWQLALKLESMPCWPEDGDSSDGESDNEDEAQLVATASSGLGAQGAVATLSTVAQGAVAQLDAAAPPAGPRRGARAVKPHREM